MFLARIRRLADRPYPGRVELAALAVLYGAYEVVQDFGSEDWVAARAHTADIVALERRLNLFVERDIQDLAGLLPGGCPRSSDSSTSPCISRARPVCSSGCTTGARTRFRSCARR